MHGELAKLRCESCAAVEEMMEEEHLGENFLACMHCEGRMRPHIVWFGEMPMQLDEIQEALLQCDVFIAKEQVAMSILSNGFLHTARRLGAHTIGINLDPPEDVAFFDEFFQGKAGEILPLLVERWTKA